METITRDYFESVLPLYKADGTELLLKNDHIVTIPLGMYKGQHTYFMCLDSKTGIVIQSGLPDKLDGIAAWLVEYQLRQNKDGYKLTYSNLGTAERFIYYIPGWENKLLKTLRVLWKWRDLAGDCVICDAPRKIYKVIRKTENEGRIFADCDRHKQFVWITSKRKKVAHEYK